MLADVDLVDGFRGRVVDAHRLGGPRDAVAMLVDELNKLLPLFVGDKNVLFYHFV